MAHTLQEFVLSLLRDPAALSQFNADPQGALGAAGLGDVSAMDVQEVMPLVLDYASADGVGALFGGQETSRDFDAQLADQLQTFAQQFDAGNDGLAEPISNAVPATLAALTQELAGGLDIPAGGSEGLTGGLTATLGNDGELSGVIDDLNEAAPAGRTAVADPASDPAIEDLTSSVAGVTDQVSDLTGLSADGLVPDDISGVTGKIEDMTGLGGASGPAEVLGNLDNLVDQNPISIVQPADSVSDVHDVVSGLTQTGDVTGMVEGLGGIGGSEFGLTD